jgi:hypothetical protein
MAVHAGDLILSRMDVVAEKDRLAWPLEVTGVADDGGLIPLGRSLGRLLAGNRRREGEEQRYYDRS